MTTATDLPWTEAMRSPSECARRYRLDRSIIAACAKSGEGPNGERLRVERRENSRGGKTNYFLNPVDADAIWFGK